MRKTELAKSELRHWAQVTHTGMSIHFAGVHPPIIDDIPHPYSCEVGDRNREYHCGYGVTEDQAVEACYKHWLDQ